MQFTSKGIVLQYFKYSEASAIVKILTEKEGLYSCFAKKISGKKSKTPISLLQPLSLITVSSKEKSSKSLPILNEINLAHPLTPISVEKTFVLMFVSEVLLKVLRPGEKDNPLFNYIWDLHIFLRNKTKLNNHFYLFFLIKLSELLGFGPNKAPGEYFDMEIAEFVKQKPVHNNIIEGHETIIFRMLLDKNIRKINYIDRRSILNHLLNFYKIHGHELKGLNTHIVINSLRK